MSHDPLAEESRAYLALARAFPDRDQIYRTVTDRWAWLAGRDRRGGGCALCRRGADEVVWLQHLRRDPALDEEFDVGERPGFHLCVACIVVLRELWDAPDDDLVLKDLRRACDDERLVVRMEELAHSTGPRPRRGEVPCELCMTDDRPRWSFEGRDACLGCIGEAGSTARFAFNRKPSTTAESRLVDRL